MPKDLSQEVLSGIRWTGGIGTLGQLVSWAITIIVIRLLSPQDYGLMAMATAFIGFLTMLNEMGLGAFIIQKQDIDEDFIRQIFGFLIAVNISIFIAVLALAPIVAEFFREERLISILRFLSLQFIIVIFSVVPKALIEKEMLFHKKAAIDLIAVLIGSLTTLLLALWKLGVWALVWGTLSLAIVSSVGYNLAYPFLCYPKFSINNMRNIVSFGGILTAARFVWFFFLEMDIFILGRSSAKDFLGFYSVAKNLASLPMNKLSAIINPVAFPAFSSVQHDPEWSASLSLKALRIIGLLSFPVLWGISALANEITSVFLGAKWYVAGTLLQILSLIVPFRIIMNLLHPAVIAFGRPDVSLSNAIFALSVMSISILTFLRWGVVGVSVCWAVIYPLVFIYNLSRLAPVLKLRILDVFSSIASPFAAALLMYLSILGFKSFSFLHRSATLHLLFLIFIGGGVYLSSILILNRKGCYEAFHLLIRGLTDFRK